MTPAKKEPNNFRKTDQYWKLYLEHLLSYRKCQGLFAIVQSERSIPRYCLVFSPFYDTKDLRSLLPNKGRPEIQVWKTSGCNEIQIHDHCDISASALATEPS